MPKWGILLVFFTSLAISNDDNMKTAQSLNEYFVVEVLSSETVYEPVAEYRYHVKALGNLSGLTDEPFPARFSTDVVLSRHTVGAGYWMLVRIDRLTGVVSAVDVTTPQEGFSNSGFFLQIFYDRLSDSLDPVRHTLIDGYRTANVKVSLGVADDFSMQSRYNKPHNNLALVATDFYIDTLISDFSPFFARYAEFNFDIVFTRSQVVVRPLKHRAAHHFFYQAIDQTEELPAALRKKKDS
jgi:hypothetical protein